MTQQNLKLKNTGSLTNFIMGNNATKPIVGEGATQLMWSDRHPYEVVAVNEDSTVAVLAPINPKRLDENGLSEMQVYNYSEVDMDNQFVVVYRNGAWYVVQRPIVFTKDHSKWVEANYKLWISDEYKEIRQNIYAGEVYPQNVVDGYTRRSTKYSKINLLFGRKEEYYDPCF